MSLTQKNTQIFPFPNPNPNPPKLLSAPKPFDETLIRRLKSLLTSINQTSPAVPLSVPTAAVDLLAATLTSFSLLLSDRSLSRSEPDVAALSSYLDASAALLHAVNSLTAAIDRLSRRCLSLAFGLHLLSHRPLTPELARKARDAIAEWHENADQKSISVSGLISGKAPCGMNSAVRRAIYAVESVSALVVGLVSSFLGERADLEKIRVSSEYSWSEAFNGVLTAVDGSPAAEIVAVDYCVEKLTAVIHNGEETDDLRSLTEDSEKRTEELTTGLDRLGSAVNGLFRAGLCSRNEALQGFRIGAKNCK